MLENTALLLGIFLMIATSGITIISWITASIFGVHTQKINFLTFGERGEIILKKIKSTEIALGWIPFGSSLLFLGMEDKFNDEEIESEIKPDYPEFDFRGKPKWIQILILIISPLIIGISGWIILINSSDISIFNLIETYTKTSLFLLPIESANNALAQAYSDPIFLAGCTFFIIGTSNLLLNYKLAFKPGTIITIFNLLLQIFPVLISITSMRLIWINFSFMNLISYLIGVFAIGILSYFFVLILAKLLPLLKYE